MAEQSPVAALFKGPLKVVNLGLPAFADNLAAAGAEVVQVDWRPPAGGDAVALDALDRIAVGGTDVEAANKKAVDILLAAKPTLIDIGVAGEVIPGMTPTTVLHSGPPVTWERMCGPMRGGVIGGADLRGPGERPRRGAKRSPPPAASRSRPATPMAPSARWPASSRRRCRYGSSRTPLSAIAPTPPSTRVSARCCATAPSPTR